MKKPVPNPSVNMPNPASDVNGCFSFISQENKTPVLIFRLNYALDLRYGVLTDIAQKIWQSKPINLTMGHVNVIWQGDANEFAIRSLLRCSYPAEILNVTGGKVLEVKELALRIGNYLGKSPTFAGNLPILPCSVIQEELSRYLVSPGSPLRKCATGQQLGLNLAEHS